MSLFSRSVPLVTVWGIYFLCWLIRWFWITSGSITSSSCGTEKRHLTSINMFSRLVTVSSSTFTPLWSFIRSWISLCLTIRFFDYSLLVAISIIGGISTFSFRASRCALISGRSFSTGRLFALVVKWLGDGWVFGGLMGSSSSVMLTLKPVALRRRFIVSFVTVNFATHT